MDVYFEFYEWQRFRLQALESKDSTGKDFCFEIWIFDCWFCAFDCDIGDHILNSKQKYINQGSENIIRKYSEFLRWFS